MQSDALKRAVMQPEAVTSPLDAKFLEAIIMTETRITPRTNRINDADVCVKPDHIIKPGDKKMSEWVAAVNQPPFFTCPADAACRESCYAGKGFYNMFADTVLRSAWRNLYFFNTDPDGFFALLNSELDEADRLRPWKYFRWHETGDIVNARYFEGMVDVARRHKNTIFMAFTKKYEIVNAWIDENGSLPKNLVIIFSIWGKYGLGVNRHNLPCAYVQGVGGDEYIAKSARECNGGCKDCDFQCWKLRKRQSVVFHKH